MNSIVLVSSDRETIAEVQTIAAVTRLNVDVVNSIHDIGQAQYQAVVFDVNASDSSTNAQEVLKGLSIFDRFVVTWQTPGPTEWKVAAALDASTIIVLPEDRAMLVNALSAPHATSATIVSVVPLVSGAGASTLSGILAHHLGTAGFDTVLIDSDSRASGLELLAGTEKTVGSRWIDIAKSLNVEKLQIYDSLPRTDSFALLSHAQPYVEVSTDLLQTVTTNVANDTDFVIIDHDPSSMTSLPTLNNGSNYVCLVLTNSIAHVAAAQKRMKHMGTLSIPHGIIVRQIPGCALDAMTIAETLDVPLWATFASSTRLVEQLEQGLGFNAINVAGTSRAAAHLATHLAPTKIRHAF